LLRTQSDRGVLAPQPVRPTGSGLDPESENRVQMFLRGITLVVMHHRAPKEVVVSLQKQVNEYLSVDDEGIFLKRAKYLLLQPMARLLKNEPPVAPAPFKWRGKFRKWMKARLVYTRKNSHLWFSFLQAKRAAAPVTESIILKTFEDHRLAMSTQLPIQTDALASERLIHDYLELMEPLLDQVASRLFNQLSDFWSDPTSIEHVASSRASYESSRKNGGQLGALFRETFGASADHEDPSRTLRRKDLRRMTLHEGVSTTSAGLESDVVVEESFYEGDLQSFKAMLDREWPRFAEKDRLTAQCQAVLEPFKVRTITKGPAIPYYLAKPLQKAMHGILKSFPCFRLIGRPLQVTDLMDIREATKFGSRKERNRAYDCLFDLDGFNPESDEEHQAIFDMMRDHDHGELEWASVDYVSSTDKLWAELSAAYLRRCLAQLEPLNPLFTKLMMLVLAPHRVEYPKVAGVKLKAVDQVNGQLMGSPLSFPILCIANAGNIMMVRKQWLGSTLIRKRFWKYLDAMLINGDDGLYLAAKREWSLHVALGSRIGLSMSPGKAYLHRRYANVNSTSIDCDSQDVTATPYLVKFLNTGLYFGQHKVLGEFSPEDGLTAKVTAPHISVMEEVWRGAWSQRESELLASYIHLHAEDIRIEQKGRNLFLPVSAGGWGVEMPDGFKNVITPFQIQIAAGILKKFPYLAVDERPLLKGKFIRDVSGEVVDPFRQPKLAGTVPLKKGPMSLVSDLKFGFVPYRFAKREVPLEATVEPMDSFFGEPIINEATWWRDRVNQLRRELSSRNDSVIRHAAVPPAAGY